MKAFFKPVQVSQVTGVSNKQLTYWDKTNHIKPSYRRKGTRRLYTFTDLVLIDMTMKLKGRGWSVQKIRRLLEIFRKLLPQVSHPLIALTFLIDEDKILVFNGDVVLDEDAEKGYVKYRVKDLRYRVDREFPLPKVEE